MDQLQENSDSPRVDGCFRMNCDYVCSFQIGRVARRAARSFKELIKTKSVFLLILLVIIVIIKNKCFV